MIICDIDGVLANFNAGVDLIMRDRNVQRYGHPKNCPTWHWMPPEEEAELWRRVDASDNFWFNLPTLPEAEDIGGFLVRTNVLFATSRKPVGTVERQTMGWLYCDGLVGSVVFRSDKARLARMLRPEFVIEDNPDTMLAIAKTGTLVYAPLYPYNAHVVHKNILRYTLLEEVFSKVV